MFMQVFVMHVFVYERESNKNEKNALDRGTTWFVWSAESYLVPIANFRTIRRFGAFPPFLFN